MDTLKAIQVFVCIAEQGSLTKAADQLGYSRAMISRYLEHLENHFATRLFQRNTRKISLTDTGEKALQYCENILQQHYFLQELSIDTQLGGQIRLTCGLFILQNGLSRCIQQFQKQYPQIQFEILITEDTLDLIDAKVDLAFRITSKVAEGLIARPILEVNSILCAHQDYLKTAEEIQTPEQLLQHPCLVHQSMSQSWTLTGLNQQPQNYPIHAVIQSNDAHALYEMCAQSMGIAMLPKAMVENDLAHGRFTQVLTHYTAPDLTLSVVYSSRLHLPAKIQKFIAYVIENLSFQTNLGN